MLPDSFKKLIQLLQKAPEVGPRQATRMAFWMLHEKNFLPELGKTSGESGKLNLCETCFLVSEAKQCQICSDAKRNKSQLMLVIKETELLTVESSKIYAGYYFIIGDFILPLKDNVLPLERIEVLKKTLEQRKKEGLQEIVFAFPSIGEGDETMNEVLKLAKEELQGLKITKLARGMPRGSEVEFADSETLKEAFLNRK